MGEQVRLPHHTPGEFMHAGRMLPARPPPVAMHTRTRPRRTTRARTVPATLCNTLLSPMTPPRTPRERALRPNAKRLDVFRCVLW